MKKIKFGNITTADFGIIVQGCNAQGVMGSGVARHIRNKWPEIFGDYQIMCQITPKTEILGKVVTSNVEFSKIDDLPSLIIANGITQMNYGADGKKYVSYKAIQDVFDTVVALGFYHKMPVHYPLIGAGLGGGDWAIISEIIDTCFTKHPEVPQILWHFE